MTKRLATLVIILSSICIVSLLCYVFLAADEKENPYNVEVFKSGDGWGYKIKKMEKVIVYQPNMPCVNGDIPFSDQESAMNTAQLVLSKINNRENPTITIEELNKIVDINNME